MDQNKCVVYLLGEFSISLLKIDLTKYCWVFVCCWIEASELGSDGLFFFSSDATNFTILKNKHLDTAE